MRDTERSRNFVVTVKERQRDEPCFLLVELHGDIGLFEDQHITLEMPLGSSFEDAQKIANTLNDLTVDFKVRRF